MSAAYASPASWQVGLEQPCTVGQALTEGARRLLGETPRLETEVLLAHLLERPRAWVLAHAEASLPPERQAAFLAALERLARGEPLAYVTGHREFFGLDFLVNRHVLVPRPETELLVQHALRFAHHAPASAIADIGTGCGCIAIALAANLPEVHLVASDVSEEALTVARSNAVRHGVVDRLEFRRGDLLEPLAMPVDLLCANLPYIDSTELNSLAVSRHEPRLALNGGPRGLGLIERLLANAPRCLNPGGAILLEIGATQGQAAAALARRAFPNAQIEIHRDLADLDRLLSIRL